MGVYLLLFINKFILFLISSQYFNITMKALIILAVAAIGHAAPAADPQLLQSGLPAGPLTPAWGDLVATPRGAASLALEGFSEDVNQDGFVDPIGQAAVAAPVVAPYAYGHYGYPYAHAVAPVVKPAEVKVVAPKAVAAPVVAHAAPVVTYAHAPVAVSHHVVHQPIGTHTYTVPVSTKTETIHLDPIVRTYTLPHVLGGHPLVVAAAAEKAPEAEAEGIIEA